MEIKSTSRGAPPIDTDSTPVDFKSENKATLRQVFAEYFDRSALVETVGQLGFRRESEFTNFGILHEKFFNAENDTVVIFTDSLSVPGRENSQGVSAIITHENRLLPGILVPTPSVDTFLDSIQQDKTHRDLESRLGYAGTHGQMEAFLHEYTHLQQVVDRTPWGTTLAALQLNLMLNSLRSQGFSPAVSNSLAHASKLDPPNLDTQIAATLVSEISAHIVNQTSAPDRSDGALKVATLIYQALEKTDIASAKIDIQEILNIWSKFISQWEHYPAASEASLKIAAEWIFEYGSI